MNRVSVTSKYHPRLSESILRLRQLKVTGSRKGQTENFMYGWHDTYFLVAFSSRTRKMTVQHFLSGPNRTILKIEKYTKPRKQRKKWPFKTSKILKLSHFSWYLLDILYTQTPDGVRSHIFHFLKVKKTNLFFTISIIFENFHNFHNFGNPTSQFYRYVHSQPSIENHSVLPLKLFAYLRDSFSREPLF